MKRLKTSKIFFNKWVYKIHCYKAKSNNIINWLDAEWQSTCTLRKQEFANAIFEFLQQDLRVRNEGDYCSIFCNDSLLADKIIKKLSGFVLTIHEPASKKELEFFNTHNATKIVRDNFPRSTKEFQGYQYKVILNYKIDSEIKEKFLSWATRQGVEKIKIPKTTQRLLERKIYWAQSPFIHVVDGPVLSMVCLYLGSSIIKIEEFVLRSSINSE
jgi:hypothetical protein